MVIQSKKDLAMAMDDVWQRLVEITKYQEALPLQGRDRTFYLAYLLYGEVGNGGFYQFYYNSSGNHAAEMVLALQETGAFEAAKILLACNKLFQDETPPQDREERIQSLDALSPQAMKFLDRASYKLMEDSDFEIRLYHYYVTGEKLTASELRSAYPAFYEGERFFQALSKKHPKEQFDFLFNKLIEMMFVPYKNRSFLDKSALDIRDYLFDLDYFDEKAVLETIESYIFAPEFNERETQEYKDFGAFTKEADLTIELLRLLERKAEPSPELEARLQRWFLTLWHNSQNKNLIGLNLKFVALTLHSFWEIKYPEPVIGSTDNKLLNASVYLRAINSGGGQAVDDAEKR